MYIIILPYKYLNQMEITNNDDLIKLKSLQYDLTKLLSSLI